MSQSIEKIQRNNSKNMKTLKQRPRNQRFSRPGGRPHQGHNHQGQGRSLMSQRNNMQQSLDRYLGLAREASGAGDRVLAESYYQYAEHYLRSLNEIKVLIDLEFPKEEVLNEGEEVAENTSVLADSHAEIILEESVETSAEVVPLQH